MQAALYIYLDICWNVPINRPYTRDTPPLCTPHLMAISGANTDEEEWKGVLVVRGPGVEGGGWPVAGRNGVMLSCQFV